MMCNCYVCLVQSNKDEPYVRNVGGMVVTTLPATHPISVVAENIWNERYTGSRRLSRRERKRRMKKQ